MKKKESGTSGAVLPWHSVGEIVKLRASSKFWKGLSERQQQVLDEAEEEELSEMVHDHIYGGK